MMYIIDIVKRGIAYKHLLLLLPFQSDNEKNVYFLHLINIKHIILVTLMFLYKSQS